MLLFMITSTLIAAAILALELSHTRPWSAVVYWTAIAVSLALLYRSGRREDLATQRRLTLMVTAFLVTLAIVGPRVVRVLGR